MNITTFAAAALLTLLPHATRRPPPGWAEEKSAYETRVRSIAADIG